MTRKPRYKFQGDAQVVGNQLQALKYCCVGMHAVLQRASSPPPTSTGSRDENVEINQHPGTNAEASLG